MDLDTATERVRLGESLAQIAASYRETLLADLGFDVRQAAPGLMAKETRRFMNRLCRHLGDRCSGDVKVGSALKEWVRQVDDYEAYDALLSGFRFEGRPQVLDLGRKLFPGPLTAHWDE